MASLFENKKEKVENLSKEYNSYLENIVRGEEASNSVSDQNRDDKAPIYRDEKYKFDYNLIKGELTNTDYDKVLSYHLRTTYITDQKEMFVFRKYGDTAMHVLRWKRRCKDYFENINSRIRYLSNLASSKQGFGLRALNRQEKIVSIDSRASSVSLENDDKNMTTAGRMD